jgi:hypothetical protein
MISAGLQGHEPANPIGRLKTLLTGPALPRADDVADTWDVGYFIDTLREALPADWRDFLVAMLAAINDPARASDLDQFPLWRDTSALPLETPWPRHDPASQTAPRRISTACVTARVPERIYLLQRLAGDPIHCGVLIYTASAGNQGTLGGLVEVTHRFSRAMKSALERARLCSSDPVCADHDPSNAQDDRMLHGAACHGCLLISETSCEARNVSLDRALLVDTIGTSGARFF